MPSARNKSAKCRECPFRHQCRKGLPPVLGPCSLDGERKDILETIARKVDAAPGKILFLDKSARVEDDYFYGTEKRQVNSIRRIPGTNVDKLTFGLSFQFPERFTTDDLSTDDLRNIARRI